MGQPHFFWLMKKFFSWVLILIFAISYGFCQCGFELDVYSGIKNSEISKSIYYESTQTKVSHLKWTQDIIPVAGVNLSFNAADFFVKTNLIAAIPMEAGSMYDSDWNLYGINKTYSISKCDTIYDFSGEVELNYAFHLANGLSLSPVLQAEYHYNEFKAHDGYGWYGGHEYAKVPRDYDVSWDNELARKAKKIAQIDYFRHSVFVFTGLEVGYNFTEKFGLKSSFKIAPFTYMYSMDTHHRVSNPNTHYVEIQTGNFSKFKLEIEPSYKLNPKICLYMNFSTIFGKEDYGDLYHDVYFEKISKAEDQPSGANYRSFTLVCGATFTIR